MANPKMLIKKIGSLRESAAKIKNQGMNRTRKGVDLGKYFI